MDLSPFFRNMDILRDLETFLIELAESVWLELMDKIHEQVIWGDSPVDFFHVKEGDAWLDLDPFVSVSDDVCMWQFGWFDSGHCPKIGCHG